MKTLRIGLLPRSIREDLYNCHAVFSDPDAIERAFYRRSVPVVIIDISQIPEKLLYHRMSDAECAAYNTAMDEDPMLRYLTVASDQLFDGMHRITARRRRGETQMEAVDVSLLVNVEAAGSICAVSILRALPAPAGRQPTGDGCFEL